MISYSSAKKQISGGYALVKTATKKDCFTIRDKKLNKHEAITTIENILKAADNDLTKCHLQLTEKDKAVEEGTSVVISHSSLMKQMQESPLK